MVAMPRISATIFFILVEKPANVEPLSDVAKKAEEMKKDMGPEIEKIIAAGASEQEMARSAYIAICIDMAAELKEKYLQNLQNALEALTAFWRVMQNIFYDDEVPRILPLREKALSAGLHKLSSQRDVW